MDRDARRRTYEARLAQLGPVTFGRIEVVPFAVERPAPPCHGRGNAANGRR
ncbi:hypothetical protein [Micromonospora sp. RTP1Z1]|uniref:hypothetical protein n=1 Tax=Micromonospora sp. RTP1Z1 TaxID=2994043 RepID=UPI0029C87C08|nr:hypothetical protein [Micromonospora sp. RTP1Z1]